MKRVLFIGRRHAGEKNDVRLLAEAVSKQSNRVDIEYGFFEEIVLTISNTDLSAYINRDNQRLDILSYDTLILIGWSHSKVYSDLAGAVAQLAKSKKINVWNSELYNERSMTKVSQMVRAALNNLAIPKTVFSLDSQVLQLQSEGLGYPLVLKDAEASRGRKNYLIRSSAEHIEVLQKNPVTPFIAQEYIKNDHSDYRIFVSAGQPALAIKRTGNAGTHLNNISAGAQAELIDLAKLPKRAIKDTVTVTRIFNRELCGVDFIENQSTGELIFLEVNLTPQIMNGAFAKEKVAAISKSLEKGS